MALSFRTPSLDDFSKDFSSIRSTLLSLIPFFTPEWTDINPSDIGVVLLELFCGAADTLHFYLDRTAREAFLPLAISRKSVRNLLKLIDFELRGPVPASTTVIFTLSSALGSDLLIPKGTELTSSTSPAVIYETDDDLTITAGSLGDEVDANGDPLFSVSATEGQSDDEELDDSDGTSFQERTLTVFPIVNGSLKVFVNEGSGEVEWTRVDTFADSDDTDLHYKVTLDEDDRVTISFGDNGNGKIPNATATIRAEFEKFTEQRGGVFGNIGADTLTSVTSTVLFMGSPIPLSVTNPSKASGGEARQTIAEAKELGPRSLRALNRAVTADDVVFFAEQFGGVASASVKQGDIVNEFLVTIIPEGGGQPTQTLLDNLETFFDTKRLAGDLLIFQGPTEVTIQLEGTVTALAGSNITNVESDVEAAIEAFFNVTTGDVEAGKTIRISDILRLIDEQPGVDYVELSKLTRVPIVKFPIKSGDYTVSTITIGQAAVAETWTLTFSSPTTFTATGSISGLQVNTGTVDVAYSSDDGEVSFTVQSNTVPPAAGDRITFIVSPLVGSIALAAEEIPILEDVNNITFVPGMST